MAKHFIMLVRSVNKLNLKRITNNSVERFQLASKRFTFRVSFIFTLQFVEN